MNRKTKTNRRMTAWEHVKSAHDHLLIAYSMINPTHFYADTLNRALRASALTMGQMPVPVVLTKKKVQKGKKG